MNGSSQTGAPMLRLLYGGGIGALLLLGVLLTVLLVRHHLHLKHEARARGEAVAAGPKVSVVKAKRSPPERMLRLFAEARPYYAVTLYAKVSGYVREMRVDKGSHVTAGEVLAVIEAPEMERQVGAAQADAANKAQLAERARRLAVPGVVAQQDADNAVAASRIAAQTLRQQQILRNYEVLQAPFDGMVTARFADPGALVQSATGAQSGALPLLAMSDQRRLRVTVYLAQSDAADVRLGDAAAITALERPGARYHGRVSRMSGELDPRTRTMLAEVDFDNSDGQLVPGGFVTVELQLRTPPYVEIPAEALIIQGRGDHQQTLVAVVGDDHLVHMKKVAVALDDGLHVRLLSGLSGGEEVAMSLGDRVADGGRVQPVTEPQAAP